MILKQKKYISLALTFALVAFLGACGSDDGPDKNGINTGNNHANDVSNDASDAFVPNDISTPDSVDSPDTDEELDAENDITDITDARDVEEGEDGDTADDADTDTSPLNCNNNDQCVDGFVCFNNTCVDPEDTDSCTAAIELGQLSPTSPLTASGSLRDAYDLMQTTCGNQGGVERVFSFTVAEDSKIDIESTWEGGQFFGVVAFRQAECESALAEFSCSTSDDAIYASAGEQIFMIVESAGGAPGEFNIELSATPESCLPGQRTCSGDTLEICMGGGQANTYACGTGCDSGQCLGNSCASPIMVTAATTFSGTLGGFDSTVNFESNAFCVLEQGTQIPTPGAELFFHFPTLQAGQIIAIDTSTGDENNNAIFIGSSCEAPMACLHTQLTPEAFEWTVPSDGDYFIVIDALNRGDSVYQYSFDILDAP